MFLTMFFKTQNIVQTMHLTMLIAHPYPGVVGADAAQGDMGPGVLMTVVSRILVQESTSDRRSNSWTRWESETLSSIQPLVNNPTSIPCDINSCCCDVMWCEYPSGAGNSSWPPLQPVWWSTHKGPGNYRLNWKMITLIFAYFQGLVEFPNHPWAVERLTPS